MRNEIKIGWIATLGLLLDADSVNDARSRACVFLAVLILASGCASPKRAPDPLAGWKGGVTAMEGSPYNKAITRDYIEYVQKLPAEEKQYVRDYNIKFFEDGSGRHAVKI